MGTTLIKAKITDQTLEFTLKPMVASGGVNEDVIEFEFDALWDGFDMVAVFYRSKREVFHQKIVDNRCTVPSEVLRAQGVFYVGVMGVKDNVTRTTNVLRYELEHGAITVGVEPPEPTPSIYEQILKTVKSTEQIAQSVRDDADAGRFDGAPGPKGDPGSDASVTAENIQSALGYAPVKDVQVAGSSVLDGGVANVPMADITIPGVIKTGNANESGIVFEDGVPKISFATDDQISSRNGQRKSIVCTNLDYAVKAAMCDGKGTAWTSAEQKAARERMGVDKEFATFEARMAVKADVAKIFNALLKQNMNWNAVAELVRAGMGEAAFTVGSQLAVQHSEYGTLLFDVAAHNHHKKPGDPDAPTMTLLMHHCIYNRQIGAGELLWANTENSALPADTYNFTLYKGGNGGKTDEDGTYQFTTTKPIPVGGGWTHSTVGGWYANAEDYKPENITNGTVTTYDAAGNVLESGLAVAAGSGGTVLGTVSNTKTDCVNAIGEFNSVMRHTYGSNNWGESAARQWLNSSAAANSWWQRQTIFDMAPSYANKAGFLAGFDPDFMDALGAVDITVARNAIYEIGDTLGGSYTTRDKLFLPSMMEIGLGSNGNIKEGSTLPLYDGATQTDCIKYDQAAQTTARYWWLRSPDIWSSCYVRIINPSGVRVGVGASYSYGLAAACVIY
nr:MAG TPA: hypothetical protein [Caudoviricetes sp.]